MDMYIPQEQYQDVMTLEFPLHLCPGEQQLPHHQQLQLQQTHVGPWEDMGNKINNYYCIQKFIIPEVYIHGNQVAKESNVYSIFAFTFITSFSFEFTTSTLNFTCSFDTIFQDYHFRTPCEVEIPSPLKRNEWVLNRHACGEESGRHNTGEQTWRNWPSI